MNYGLYLSSSGMLTNMSRMDVFANNLANVSTAAFKPDVLAVRQRDVVRVEDDLPSMDSNRLLERLGGGVMPARTRINMSPAALTTTDRQLDVGIEGDGFLVVRAGAGADGLRLTRDGRLAIGADGRLVMASSGASVMDVNQLSIHVDPRQPIFIDADGVVRQGEGAVGRIAFVGADATDLVKEGDNLLRSPAGGLPEVGPPRGRIVQGSIEASGVNAISAMMDVTGAAKAVESNARMVSYFDELMNRAINTLGRVS